MSGSVTPGGTGLLGKLMVSAPSVREALGVMNKYGHVHMTKVVTGVDEVDGLVHAHWTLPSEITAPRLQYSSFLSALIVRRLAEAIGGDWRPLSCEFAHRAFDCREDAARVFGDRLEFDAPKNEFVFEQRYLDCPMPHANAMMFAVYEDLMRRWGEDLETERTPNVVISVREQILHCFQASRLKGRLTSPSLRGPSGLPRGFCNAT